MYYFICIAVLLLLVIGCTKKQDDKSRNTDTTISSAASSNSDSSETILVFDVRTAQEYSSGHIKEAINIPYTEIANKIEKYAGDKDQKILLYCLSGSRSGIALNTLKNLGYTNVENIGGYEDAKAYFKSIQQK